MDSGPRILIVGGGYAGMHTALRLERLLRPGEATMMIADPRSYMTYQPLLAEAAAGNLEPRHVVVPLRGVLRHAQIIKAAVSSVDHARRVAQLTTDAGESWLVGYDILVVAPGSISRVLPVPGLAEAGIGFKTIGEAIHLRNHVLGQLDAAASTGSAQARRAALTFVFTGGGYAGVEALAELHDMAFDASARYPELSHREMRWILVEAADRILPEVSPAMADYTAALLRRRHVEVRLHTRLVFAEGGRIRLDDGEEFSAGTLVWTAGVTPSPVTGRLVGLPTDAKGRVIVSEFLAVQGADDAWALGDCAAVPDLAVGGGALCAPTAQHAYRQAHSGRQHHRGAARRRAAPVPARLRRVGSQSGPVPRRCGGLRSADARLPRLADPAYLPPAEAADDKPAAARLRFAWWPTLRGPRFDLATGRVLSPQATPAGRSGLRCRTGQGARGNDGQRDS